MQDSSRSRASVSDGADSDQARDGTKATPTPSAPPQDGEVQLGADRFVGHAMKALFESSDVSIRRGDETRVMSRAQEALAEIQRKTSAPPPREPKPAVPSVPTVATGSLRASGPRVDAVLWIVLAVGLFAIAGWMVAYAL
jgi:hypothetical protein